MKPILILLLPLLLLCCSKDNSNPVANTKFYSVKITRNPYYSSCNAAPFRVYVNDFLGDIIDKGQEAEFSSVAKNSVVEVEWVSTCSSTDHHHTLTVVSDTTWNVDND